MHKFLWISLFLIPVLDHSQGRITTVVHSINITNYGNIANGNVSVTYKNKGDLSSYGVNIDEDVQRDLAIFNLRYKVIKYPSINHWEGGTVMIDVNLEMCQESGKSKTRKGDFASPLFQLLEKYGNFTCPIRKQLYSFRDLTINGMKMPMTQYLFGDDDYKLVHTFYTKINKKLVKFQTLTTIAGTRKVKE